MSHRDPYVVVEESDLSAVLPTLVEVLNATRSNEPTLRRFSWLYQENPDGPAVVWTLRRRDSGEIIGFTSCIPRRIRFQGETRNCWIGADFSILAKYRSLGLALRLRRAAKTAIDQGRADFLYAHPNDRMAVIHDKVGHQRIGTMIRLARPISVKPILAQKQQTKLFAGVASRILDPILHAASREWRTATTGSAQLESKLEFTSDFDRLFESAESRRPLVGVRNAEYLNWRYAQNPLREFRLLTLKDAGVLKGYLIYSVSSEDEAICIQDIFPSQPDYVVYSLLKQLWRIGRQYRARSISITLLESCPLISLLKRFHYVTRPEATQMFSYAPAVNVDKEVIYDKHAWYITVGDRDV